MAHHAYSLARARAGRRGHAACRAIAINDCAPGATDGGTDATDACLGFAQLTTPARDDQAPAVFPA
eukprot:COSAG02_NODE_65714_length_257_cov_0.759494_1_plen_65_part_10